MKFCTSNYEPCDYWVENVIYDAKTIAALMGIHIEHVHFSGFWSQGDGACFTGRLGWEADCLDKVKGYAPTDTELHEIATLWQAAGCEDMDGAVSHRGRYYHSNSVSFEFEEELADLDESRIIYTAKRFMDWIYQKLEDNYEYAKADSLARSWMTAMETIEEGRAEVRELTAALRTGLLAGVAKEAIEYKLQDVWRGMDVAKREREFIDDNFYYCQNGEQISIQQFAKENL